MAKQGFRSIIHDFCPGFQFSGSPSDIRDQKINLSESGKTAWFFCMLNDISTWKGQQGGWENTRWTGVLEKRNGCWVIVQQHFSFANK